MGSKAALKVYERRNLLRTRLTVPATITAGGAEYRALLGNLSEDGAMVETPNPLEQGQQVEISCGSIRAIGVVTWQGANRSGIRFDTPIAEAEIARQILWSNAAAYRARTAGPRVAQATEADPG
jgi:hypothetical protein